MQIRIACSHCSLSLCLNAAADGSVETFQCLECGAKHILTMKIEVPTRAKEARDEQTPVDNID